MLGFKQRVKKLYMATDYSQLVTNKPWDSGNHNAHCTCEFKTIKH